MVKVVWRKVSKEKAHHGREEEEEEEEEDLHKTS